MRSRDFPWRPCDVIAALLIWGAVLAGLVTRPALEHPRPQLPACRP